MISLELLQHVVVKCVMAFEKIVRPLVSVSQKSKIYMYFFHEQWRKLPLNARIWEKIYKNGIMGIMYVHENINFRVSQRVSFSL